MNVLDATVKSFVKPAREEFLCVESFVWKDSSSVTRLNDARRLRILWPLSGAASFVSELESTEISLGQLVILGQDHPEIRILKPFSGHCLDITRDFLSSNLTSLFTRLEHFFSYFAGPYWHIRLSEKGQSDAGWLLSRLLNEDYSHAETARVSLSLTLGQLLLLCYREATLQGVVYLNSTSAREEVIRRLLDYIDHNISSDLSLKKLAKYAGYAPSYLSSAFSRTTGRRLTQYINEKRISRAQELLQTTNLKVIEICYDVGYRDLSHFNRTFKQITGETPNQCREQARTRSENETSGFRKDSTLLTDSGAPAQAVSP